MLRAWLLAQLADPSNLLRLLVRKGPDGPVALRERRAVRRAVARACSPRRPRRSASTRCPRARADADAAWARVAPDGFLFSINHVFVDGSPQPVAADGRFLNADAIIQAAAHRVPRGLTELCSLGRACARGRARGRAACAARERRRRARGVCVCACVCVCVCVCVSLSLSLSRAPVNTNTNTNTTHEYSYELLIRMLVMICDNRTNADNNTNTTNYAEISRPPPERAYPSRGTPCRLRVPVGRRRLGKSAAVPRRARGRRTSVCANPERRARAEAAELRACSTSVRARVRTREPSRAFARVIRASSAVGDDALRPVARDRSRPPPPPLFARCWRSLRRRARPDITLAALRRGRARRRKSRFSAHVANVASDALYIARQAAPPSCASACPSPCWSWSRANVHNSTKGPSRSIVAPSCAARRPPTTASRSRSASTRTAAAARAAAPPPARSGERRRRGRRRRAVSGARPHRPAARNRAGAQPRRRRRPRRRSCSCARAHTQARARARARLYRGLRSAEPFPPFPLSSPRLPPPARARLAQTRGRPSSARRSRTTRRWTRKPARAAALDVRARALAVERMHATMAEVRTANEAFAGQSFVEGEGGAGDGRRSSLGMLNHGSRARAPK